MHYLCYFMLYAGLSYVMRVMQTVAPNYNETRCDCEGFSF